jgi:hypothetical protein
VLSRALQNYYVDNSDFPTQLQGLVPLSEPVTYLASIPQDVFARHSDQTSPYTYRTYNEGSFTVWVLISRGPDGDLDFDNLDVAPVEFDDDYVAQLRPSDPVPPGLSNILSDSSYDPTNGLFSDGDVFTLSPFARN